MRRIAPEPVICIAAFIAAPLFLLAFVLIGAGGIRFTSRLVNHVAFAVACLAPWMAAWGSARYLRGQLRDVVIICLCFLGLILLPVAGIAIYTTRHEPSSQLLTRIPVGEGHLDILRTNCGAPCSYGIGVERVRPVLPGLVVTERLEGFYPGFTATYEWLADSAIRITVPPYVEGSAEPSRSRVYDVR